MIPDQVRISASIPQKMNVSSFTAYLKGKIAMMFFKRHANSKYKLGEQKFLGNRIMRENGGDEYCNDKEVYT